MKSLLDCAMYVRYNGVIWIVEIWIDYYTGLFLHFLVFVNTYIIITSVYSFFTGSILFKCHFNTDGISIYLSSNNVKPLLGT